jgi:hypothetical protein
MMMTDIDSASFKDPSGQVFYRNGIVYRTVKQAYSEHYDLLMGSGLYHYLIEKKLLIPHEEVPPLTDETDLYKTISPENVRMISYPWEWSFSQLKDAALCTLRIQKAALEYGMTLKDANAFNIQFHNGRPVLIDTLSFEKLQPDTPWIAYREFCEHFYAPLILMSSRDVRLVHLFRTYIKGIPLDLAVKLIPWYRKLDLNIRIHIIGHAQVQKKYENRGTETKQKVIRYSKQAFQGLVLVLMEAIKKLRLPRFNSEWDSYYRPDVHEAEYQSDKKSKVMNFLDSVNPGTLWDVGANDGTFTRLAVGKGISCTAFDIDPNCVERNYLVNKKEKGSLMLPLLMDLTNPSPGLGWAHSERAPLSGRSHPDVLMALALIHHLAISNNVPLDGIASWFSGLSKKLIIEFVPKNDPKVQILLTSRKDIFLDYTEEKFEETFKRYYRILGKENLLNSSRVLYLMEAI